LVLLGRAEKIDKAEEKTAEIERKLTEMFNV